MAYGGRIVVVGNRGRIEIDPRKTMGKDGAILGMALWNTTPDDVARIYQALDAGLAERNARAGGRPRNCRWPTPRARTS